MLGLIKKDLALIKGNIGVLITVLIVISLMSINGGANYSFMPAFMSVVLMMSTFSYDEFNKSNAYIIALPNGKKNAVKAKYLATILFTIPLLILALIMSIVTSQYNHTISLEEIIATTIGSFAGIVLVQAIIYPPIYKYGIEKSRIMIFIGSFGIGTIASLLVKIDLNIKINSTIINILNNYWMLIIPLISLIILYLSYRLSNRIYNKKEF